MQFRILHIAGRPRTRDPRGFITSWLDRRVVDAPPTCCRLGFSWYRHQAIRDVGHTRATAI
jgi:hypothetical protein